MITRMDTPLGRAVGNALEVIESIEVLKGQGPADLVEISLALAARMLVLAGVAATDADALERVSGRRSPRARRSTVSGGSSKRRAAIRRWSTTTAACRRLRSARRSTASRGGYVTQIDAELVGRASVVLGAGRDRVEDDVDPAVGIILKAQPGAAIRAGDPVLELHYRTIDRRDAARALAERAIVIDDAPPPERPPIVARIS